MSIFRKLVGGKAIKNQKDAGKDQAQQHPDTMQDLEAYSISTQGKLGLDLLYEPHDKAAATVDIIFVHGLTGNREVTWTHKTNGVFWPKDLLKRDVPTARILTFGYDADVVNFAKPAARNTVEDHATNLTKELMFARERTDSAIAISADSPDVNLRKIASSTYAVVFLGTPHTGSELAKWAQGAASIIGLFKAITRDILAVLEQDSQVLWAIENRFQKIVKIRGTTNTPIHTACFFEELAVQGLGRVVSSQLLIFDDGDSSDRQQIVPKNSAAFLGSEPVGIHENHMNMTKFQSRDTNGYKAVANQIVMWEKAIIHDAPSCVEDITPTIMTIKLFDPQSFKVDFELPRYVVPFFVPRPHELSNIATFLTPGQAAERRKIFVLHGLGGTGKTQLMLEFARSHSIDYTAKIWLNGATEDLLIQSLLDVASRITSGPIVKAMRDYATAQDQPSQSQEAVSDPSASASIFTRRLLRQAVISAVYDWLKFEGNKKWLLLFDNVDKEFPSPIDDSDAYDLGQYIPSADHGAVLVTTRHLPLCSLGDRSMTLTKMNEEQGLQVVAERSGYSLSELPSEAKELVKRVHGLPLALAQAGAYLRFNPGIADYLELYSTKWKEIMGGNADHDISLRDYAHGSVGTTWSVSYEYIKQKYPLAGVMLKVLAYFNGSDISHEIFKVDGNQTLGHWRQPPPELVTELYDLTSFKRLMAVLVEFAFLQRSPGRETYEIHPVVQDWSLFSSTSAEQDEFSVLAFRILGLSIMRAIDIYFVKAQTSRAKLKANTMRKRLKIHSSRCLLLLDPQVEYRLGNYKEPICHGLCRFGLLQYYLGYYDEAIILLRRSFCGFMSISGEDNADCRLAGQRLAIVLTSAERYAEAEDVLEGILENISGENCKKPFVRNSILRCLAQICAKSGRSEKAEFLFRQVLTFYSQNTPKDYSSINLAQTQLGDLLMEEKRTAEAAEVFAEAFSIAKEAGPEFPRITYGDLVCKKLAAAYKKIGKYEEAKSVLLMTLSWFEETYGTEDDWVFIILRYLGGAYEDLQQFDKAEQQYRRMIAREMAWAPRDADQWVAPQELANVLRKRKKFHEAEELLCQILQERGKALGLDHSDNFETKYLLGLVREDEERFEEAEKLYNEAFNGRKANILDITDVTLLKYTEALENITRIRGRYAETNTLLSEVTALP
ncbi:hypothetical protein MMC11_001361 [Xylographa trunciseda]|nr:hypothetical protein [Xylographa trunciseda]